MSKVSLRTRSARAENPVKGTPARPESPQSDRPEAVGRPALARMAAYETYLRVMEYVDLALREMGTLQDQLHDPLVGYTGTRLDLDDAIDHLLEFQTNGELVEVHHQLQAKLRPIIFAGLDLHRAALAKPPHRRKR